MIVKTWRVHLIFSQNSLEVFKISNKKVALFLSLLLSVDGKIFLIIQFVICSNIFKLIVILFIVWVSVSSPKSELHIVDEYRPSLNYYKCSSSRAGEGIIWAMVGYHVCVFFYLKSCIHINNLCYFKVIIIFIWWLSCIKSQNNSY